MFPSTFPSVRQNSTSAAGELTMSSAPNSSVASASLSVVVLGVPILLVMTEGLRGGR